MKIAVAADHAGLPLKQRLAERLRALGHEVRDFGTHTEASCDYPDFGAAAARDVAEGGSERAILVCTTGAGMSIAANKVSGIRAVLGMNEDSVRLTREHNDANVLALASKYTPEAEAWAMTRAFLETEFSKGERHVRRLEKITALEEQPVRS
jgi:ribose 5-phosphate isomerase B